MDKAAARAAAHAKAAVKTKPAMANAWFFPAAALYGLLIVPLSVGALLGLWPALPGLTSSLGHAHELLFGYALAVVAGYLLGPQPKHISVLLLAAWLAARLSFLLWPSSYWASACAALFAGGLAWQVLPRFIGKAKKWRNQSVAPIVGLLAMLSSLPAVSSTWLDAAVAVRSALLLLATLIFFMGGRIIAPSLAGAAQAQGWQLVERVQPKLEGLGLLGLGGALLLSLWPLAAPLAGALLMALAILVLVRWLRWKPWRFITRLDLCLLLLGYVWLVPGLALYGASLLWALPGANAALHALSIGALGTLTLTVMARTRLMQRFRDANAKPWVHLVALLPSLAALARVLPALYGTQQSFWLMAAGALWCTAFAGLLFLMWQLRDSQTPARGIDPRQNAH